MKKPTHGKPSTYVNYECRCKRCIKAWCKYLRVRAAKMRKRRATCLHENWRVRQVRKTGRQMVCCKCLKTKMEKFLK